MIRPRWRKVVRDLWGNKVRSLLVILSIAIGVFAIGMIVGTQILLREDLSTRYAATNPASAILYTDWFDEEFLHTIRRMDSVQEAGGRRTMRIPLQVGPQEWKQMNLTILADYDDVRIHKITPVSGAWPPPERTLLVERASLPEIGMEVGDTVVVETADGKVRELTISGVAHDIFTEPVQFTGQPNAYITLDTLEWLGYSRLFDELHIVVAEGATDKAHVEAVADDVKAKVEKSGRAVPWVWVPEPGEHPANEVVKPMLAILGVLGVLSLFASSFLIVNIINGLLAQHTQQIGIMKAIGARTGQIAQMYLVAVVVFGLLSLVLAVPLGGLAAYGLTAYIAGLINFDLAGFRIPVTVIVVQTTVAILVPVLVALIPVIRGTRLTVREALSEYGLGSGQFGTHLLDRMVEWISGRLLALSRPMRISLRNTIRRKARLALTLSTLVLGGAIFIGVLNVRASLLATLDEALAYFNYDVAINFAQPHRIEEIHREALKVPGVADVESWVGNNARRLQAGGQEGESFVVLGTQANTNFIQPKLLEGRWLLPEDENALVLNSLVIKDDPGIKLGDTIVLKINERETEWQIVGVVQGVMTGPIAYANQGYLARVLHFVGQSANVQVIIEPHDAAFQSEVARRLKDHFDSVGMQVTSTEKIFEVRENIEFQFNIIVVLLAVMAILIALVGGLGLMGTMSINVLERTREIGVMRALGASDGSVLRIVLIEGILVGVISWFAGGLLAYPIGKLLSDIVGISLLESPLTYRFATSGALGWLLVVLLIAGAASFLPAWNASRYSVRQTLAYE